MLREHFPQFATGNVPVVVAKLNSMAINLLNNNLMEKGERRETTPSLILPLRGGGGGVGEKGITIYLSIIVLSILLAIIFGLSIFLIDQIRMVKDMENSISAFYAADSGIEEALKVMINDENNLLPTYGPTNIGGGASYTANISCCSSSNSECNFYGEEDCPVGVGENPDCLASRYCVRSVGTAGGVKRAIESSY